VRSGATGWLSPAVVAFAAASSIAGCASLSPELQPAETFSLVGRVAVRYGDEAASGRVTWRHGAATDDLLISSPLGQGIAEITRRDGVYTLVTAKDQRFTAADPERLTEQALGWALPLGGLPDWVQGRPQPGVSAEPRYADGRLAELRQLGWTIEYTGYDENGRLPTRMRLVRGDLDIRLAIDEWQHAPR
jgi:outer membrane lipoprotein LolB